MKKTAFFYLFIFLLLSGNVFAQDFSDKDSLRGGITKERVWWDLLHYDIQVSFDIDNKSIAGKNKIQYRVIENSSVIQIDLQDPMKVLIFRQDGEFLAYKRKYDSYFVKLKKPQDPGSIQEIIVEFEGVPKETNNPPWDGGFVWKKDEYQRPFIANANQSIGSSSWLPSKDIPYDEPDNGMDIHITANSELMSVSNGRLIDLKKNKDGTATSHWKVINPINGYCINMNLGDYVHFDEVYQGESGPLDLDYYVISYNLEKAKKQFKQVPKMLEAFEFWFGPYPFYEDGYKLVEAPYLGMEHQSSVTYGNEFENGYLGGDLSNTGNGLKFDFIIVHESGHEWFANSITNYDVADMWIHESFTTYSEVLYLDYHFGTEAGNAYLKGYRTRCLNDIPIIGSYGFNQRGSVDMYIKGAAMIHTLRQVINDDEKFRTLLRNINKEFYHQTVSSAQIENYIIKETNLELKGFFDQYLRTVKIPEFQYKIKNKRLKFRYKNIVDEFKIPLRVYINNEELWLNPTKEWQEIQLDTEVVNFALDDNFYIKLIN